MSKYKRKHKKRLYRYPEWIKLQIDNLKPGEWFVIPAHITPSLNERNFRVMLSRMNSQTSLNLKFHKDGETYPGTVQWWVWHDPSFKKHRQTNHWNLDPSKVQQLKQLRALNIQLKTHLENEDFPSATHIQSQMDLIKNQIEQPSPKLVYRNKKSITHSLKTILEYLHLTNEQWKRIDAKDRIRLRVQTDLKLKFYGTMREG